jgi:hypothetical protein
MRHSAAGWKWLYERAQRHGLQVALLQEAVPPPADVFADMNVFPSPAADDEWSIRTPIDATSRRWASAVAVFDPHLAVEPVTAIPLHAARSGELAISHPGQWRAVRVLEPGRCLVMVSVYGLWNDVPSYAVPSVHRAISDLTPLLWSRDHALVAGDLNVWRGHGDWRAGYATVFDRLTAERMCFVGPAGTAPAPGCACGATDSCTHVPTFRKGDQRRWQTDFVFASSDTTVSCAVEPDDGSWEVSDHAAITGVIQW